MLSGRLIQTVQHHNFKTKLPYRNINKLIWIHIHTDAVHKLNLIYIRKKQHISKIYKLNKYLQFWTLGQYPWVIRSSWKLSRKKRLQHSQKQTKECRPKTEHNIKRTYQNICSILLKLKSIQIKILFTIRLSIHRHKTSNCTDQTAERQSPVSHTSRPWWMPNFSTDFYVLLFSWSRHISLW